MRYDPLIYLFSQLKYITNARHCRSAWRLFFDGVLRQPHLARPPTPSQGYKGQALEKKKHDYRSHGWNGKHDRIAQF